MREKAEKENQNYVQEMKEPDRTLEQDRKLKEFMAAKISDRSERVDVSKESDLKPLGESAYVNGSGYRVTQCKKCKPDKDASNTSKFASTEGLAESLESYEKAFENIRKVTNITDIGELVQKFKEVEDQNFSLFNFVNEINNEIEMEAEGIVSVQRKIDGLKIENIEAEQKRAGVMKGLEVRLIDMPLD